MEQHPYIEVGRCWGCKGILHLM